jgi:hypothetical protein
VRLNNRVRVIQVYGLPFTTKIHNPKVAILDILHALSAGGKKAAPKLLIDITEFNP